MQTRRHSASFARLNSSQAQMARELWWCKVTAKKWLTRTFKGKNNPEPEVIVSFANFRS